MEWEMGLAVLGVVAVTAAAVYLVSVMGIKEKSFEEAIAEQKKRSEDLLGKKESKKKAPVKDKSKKQKKAKEKEKHQVPSSSYVGELDAVDNQTTSHHHHHQGEGGKHHVEIDPEPEILDDDAISESRRASVVRMKDVIKPILINKEEHSPVVEQNDIVESANHFEVIHPKDDLELKKHINYDDSPPPSPPPPLPQRNLKKSNQKRQQQQQQPPQQQVQEEIGNGDPPPSSEANVSGYYENVPVIDEQLQFTDAGQGDILKGGDGIRNRKTKQQQQRGEQDQLTAAKLETTIEKVSLSSSEIQNLIDILLNKQHAGDSEWINKGKNDSVGNLKKQLAERERQLNEEQVTTQTLQSKLKDLRFEFTSEKTKFAQIRRQLEDASNQKMQDVQQLQNQLTRIRQEAGVEKQQLQQKLQQMQISLSALRDENTAVKSALNVEQSNRGKADSLEREAEALRTQCGHLENQLKAAFQSNQELSNQSRNLQEHLRVLEERKKQEEHNIHAQYAQQIQDREAHLVSEIKKFQDLLAEGEKERISLRQQTTSLQNSIRNSQEQAITLDEVTKKMEELREAEKNHKNLLEDSVNQVSSLKNQLQGSDSKVKSLEEERKNLLDQISTLNEKQVAAEKEREKLNGDIQSADKEAVNANKSRLAELEKTLSEKEGQLAELNKANSQYKVDIETSLQDLKNQREKNDELRQKNTKLMDTLSVTEKNLEVRVTQCELLVQEERTKSETAVKSNLLKYFPQIKSDLSNPDWIDTFSKNIQEEMNKAQPISANNDSKLSLELNLQEVNSRLQEEVTHYQNVLSSTETLLSNLQSSIEKEERKWHQKLEQKDAELKAALGQSPSVNADLKTQLDGEREEKSVLLERCSELENNIQNLKKQLEQVDTLRNQLEKVQEEVKQERKNGTELSTEKSRLEAEVIKHQESYKVEQTRVIQLQTEVESLRKQVSLDDSVNSSVISSNGVVNGKSVDGSEPVVKTPSSPQHASSSAATSPPVTPTATNADLPITTSKDKDTKEPKKKKKGAGARKDR